MEDLMRIFLNIRIRDILDIAIVAFVFYKLYMLIRETRAEQLIKGIIVLLLATQISEWLQLYVINWILRNTMTVGLIALLIVFQPELRRALEYIGRTKFLTKSIIDIEHEEMNMVVEEIVEAVASLSRQKIGALIVLEKQTGLNEVVETGTVISGRVSRGLLINIFMPNTPLHDGALVIRKTTILAAGCFLPLTENPNLSKELGTRHRAGLGITERSDSIVVIVSEETGAISVAENGKLTRFLDIITLRVRLINSFKKVESKQWQFLKFKRGNKRE
ncbi:diadenylate cyclase CdaA [Serpentinicella alkaliphila]|uniref:Diadenylate cyclase n=1 Tax=Serpentinicella alkaliphila TaxID=1734049 RepID=A0A4R2TI13_9FIRM|nr:diadenylate cyclase CdaA [Serpentinicella alkaliphila]QUH25530.1 TIGR00159 family protein [Serpentinicella alkaliphila]TCQ01882.1 diadenylate cyclase [Serpentinicella alkaliphila]